MGKEKKKKKKLGMYIGDNPFTNRVHEKVISCMYNTCHLLHITYTYDIRNKKKKKKRK